ncbi:MAG: hypothetical protein Q4G71_15735 [Pseudomonadota bacterium]|nr:hypothetical protein [Pseudomonadota bacterium]
MAFDDGAARHDIKPMWHFVMKAKRSHFMSAVVVSRAPPRGKAGGNAGKERAVSHGPQAQRCQRTCRGSARLMGEAMGQMCADSDAGNDTNAIWD